MRERSAGRALLVILGWSAVVFAVLASPIVALGRIRFTDLVPTFGFGGSAATTGTTFAPLPAAQCERFGTIRDVGVEAFMATSGARGSTNWPASRATIDRSLARYEFVLQVARRDTPRQVEDDLRRVAESVHLGRAVLAASGSGDEFADRVFDDMTGGFGALMSVQSKLGSACGRDFTFVPASLPERLPDAMPTR